MINIKTIEKLVMETLEIYSDSRSDDFILYGYVCLRKNPALLTIKTSEALINHKKYGLPAFASVRRIKYKVFKKHPELKPER